MTFSEEFEHIKAAIYDNPRSDPGRLETCLSIALEALGEIAEANAGGNGHRSIFGAPKFAQEALRRMEMRVRLGDDQPADITYPYHEVLSPGPDGGDWG